MRGGRSCVCWGRGASIWEEDGRSGLAHILTVEEVVLICFTSWDMGHEMGSWVSVDIANFKVLGVYRIEYVVQHSGAPSSEYLTAR